VGGLEMIDTKAQDIKFQILKNLSDFSDLDDDDLLELSHISKLCNFPKGTIIYREGDEPDFMYIISEGRIKSFSSSFSGRTIGGNISSDLIGLNNLLSGDPRWLTAQTVDDVTALRISRQDLLSYLPQRPKVQMKFLIRSDRMLNIIANRLMASFDCSAQQRIVDVLYGLYEKFGPLLSLKMAEIASQTGLTRETTIRIVSRLRKKGTVEVIHNGIRIKDANGLRLLKLYTPQI
jgi:CRP/FNR family cyclic AMP-dependent transcriptional regulator